MQTPRARRFGGWIKAGIAFLAMSALACSSGTELTQVNSQLTDLQIELLKLQKSSPNKDEVAAIETAVERSMDSLLQSNAELRLELNQLVSKVDQLEGKLESTNFRLTQLSQLISAANQELQAVRSATEAAQERASLAPQTTINPTDPRELYDTAYNDYLQGNFDLAILAFRRYVEAFPTTDLADNATYWIGECYYSQGKFKKAIDLFDEVLSSFPESDRIPSTLLKKGYAYLELGQRGPGIVQLQSVSCEYVGTDEAHLALQRLAQMGIDVDC